MKDLRSAVEALCLQQAAARAGTEFRWSHNENMVADGLTKTKPAAMEPLMRLIKDGKWKLVYDPEMLSTRRRKQLGFKDPTADNKEGARQNAKKEKMAKEEEMAKEEPKGEEDWRLTGPSEAAARDTYEEEKEEETKKEEDWRLTGPSAAAARDTYEEEEEGGDGEEVFPVPDAKMHRAFNIFRDGWLFMAPAMLRKSV